MGNDFKKGFQKQKEVFKPIVNLSVKRLYVFTFNIYSWFWLVREIFVRHSTNFEEYLLWFFMVVGVHFFVLDNNDIFFKIPNRNKVKKLTNGI